MKGAFYQGNKSFGIGDSPPQPPKAAEVRLDIAYSGSKSTELAAKAHKAKLVTEKHTVTTDLEQVTTLTGETGWDLHTSRPGYSSTLFCRNTFFEDKNGKVVHFSFISINKLDELDVQDMVQSYSASADDGSEVPRRKLDARVFDAGTKDATVGGG